MNENKQLELVHTLADHAVEAATQKDLIRLYWDDSFNYYNDLDLSDLLEIASDLDITTREN